MCIDYPLLLYLPPILTNSCYSLWRHGYLRHPQVRIREKLSEINSSTQNKGERSEEISRCSSLLIINVAWFTPMIWSLQTRHRRIHKTLEFSSLIPCFSNPNPTPSCVRQSMTIAGLKQTLGLAYLTQRNTEIINITELEKMLIIKVLLKPKHSTLVKTGKPSPNDKK